jgi:ferredoxin
MFYVMIITEQKPFELILQKIQNGSLFIIGCNQCAALCHTGGESEVLEIKKKFESNNIQVTGWAILDPACHRLNNKRLLKPMKEELDKSDHILILTCGNGSQVIQELYPQKSIISGTNSLFLGAEINRGIFIQECILCGSCNNEEFEGLCPISHCPKQMLNGPCGGSMVGRCELSSELDCVWEKIIKRKMEKKKFSSLKEIIPPKDWTKYKFYNWRNHDKA